MNLLLITIDHTIILTEAIASLRIYKLHYILT